MISLYFHIPFCYKKCNYCSFYVVPTKNFSNSEKYKDLYLQALKADIDFQIRKFNPDKKIYTIYFGWWTPSEFWIKRIQHLIEFVKTRFDLSELEEFSFEINPVVWGRKSLKSSEEKWEFRRKEKNWNFVEDTIEFVKELSQLFTNKTRISMGIQSLDDNLLKLVNRNYDFEIVQQVLENFPNIRLNLDFISFGLEEFLDKKYFDKFEKFVNKFKEKVDSYSIYTLELYPGSIFANSRLLAQKVWFKQDIEEKILDNFKKYTNILKKAGYLRYEISNFAKSGKESKHNMIYWTMKPYLWFWVSASGYINLRSEEGRKRSEEKDDKITNLTGLPNLTDLTDWEENKFSENSLNNSHISKSSKSLTNLQIPIRYTNTYGIQNYLKKKFDFYEYKKLTWKEFLQEKVFLGLRTTKWIEITKEIESILNMDKLNNEFVTQWYLMLKNWKLVFTDKWFDVYNYVITEILDF